MKPLITALANHNILVIGDIILDEYLTGRATRMSREAPIPVLEFESRRLIPGGAANPAANITTLGSKAIQVGLVGDDEFARPLCQTIADRDIDTSGILTDTTRTTTVKTRVMAQMGLRFPQQVARMDRVSRQPISAEIQHKLLHIITDKLANTDAVLLSDYRAGMLTPFLVNSIREAATNHILTADAQGELSKYTGFTLVKCNADEARTYLGRNLHEHDEFATAAIDLCHQLALTGAMVITRGAAGATVATADGKIIHAQAPAVIDVYDTVGAGDTTIAVLTLALAAGANYRDAATLANYASGLVVRRVGNYAPTPETLAQAIEMWRDE